MPQLLEAACFPLPEAPSCVDKPADVPQILLMLQI